MRKIQLDKQRGKKILSAMVTILLICAVLMCFSVLTQVMSKGYATIGGYSFFRVVTGSMEPTIPIESLIVCKSVDIHVLDVGDIVCFRAKYSDIYGQSITHRVIGISQDETGVIQLQTKGDYNTAADPYYVTSENLIGKVVWWSDKGNVFSGLMTFFSGKISFLTFIVFPSLVIAGLIFRNNVKNVTRGLAEAKEELRKIKEREEEERKNPTAPLGVGTSGIAPPSPKAPDKPAEPIAVSQSAVLDSQEYQEMYERIRAELLEELKQEYDREKTK